MNNYVIVYLCFIVICITIHILTNFGKKLLKYDLIIKSMMCDFIIEYFLHIDINKKFINKNYIIMCLVNTFLVIIYVLFILILPITMSITLIILLVQLLLSKFEIEK